MNLGEYIATKRKDKGWSQRDLAAASNVSNAEISRLESGKRKEPSPIVLKEIARALSVPYEEILQVAGIIDDYYEEKGKEFVASHSEDAITKDLTDEELEEVKKFIDYIISKRK